MIEMSTYKGADGSVDWSAYKRAQINAGEICQKCQSYISSSFGRNSLASPQLCYDCKALEQETGEVSHEDYIRCPKCRFQFAPYDREMYAVFADGSHDVGCPECEHKFEIQTEVSYSFTSPELEDDRASQSEEDRSGQVGRGCE